MLAIKVDCVVLVRHINLKDGHQETNQVMNTTLLKASLLITNFRHITLLCKYLNCKIRSISTSTSILKLCIYVVLFAQPQGTYSHGLLCQRG